MRTNSTLFKVDPGDINFIQSVIISYDGMAMVSTVDPREGIIEIRVPPGCETGVLELIDSLKKHDKVMITRC